MHLRCIQPTSWGTVGNPVLGVYLNPNQVLGASKNERFCKFCMINVWNKSIRIHSLNNESNPYSGADLRVTDSQVEFPHFWYILHI